MEPTTRGGLRPDDESPRDRVRGALQHAGERRRWAEEAHRRAQALHRDAIERREVARRLDATLRLCYGSVRPEGPSAGPETP